jgi:hypothetical protein
MPELQSVNIVMRVKTNKAIVVIQKEKILQSQMQKGFL